ncbi:MAG: LPS export ABC transporter ATP-binding protein [Planctomycetes bacterium]|nr:LPS export ABC transporter ATP-binding protein [Planctomycetota bacterium]
MAAGVTDGKDVPARAGANGERPLGADSPAESPGRALADEHGLEPAATSAAGAVSALAVGSVAAGASEAAPSAQPKLLCVEGLEKVYGGRRVVDGVSFEVQAGAIIGLLGRNGAGKTTTFKMAIGMVTPRAGRVRLRGEDVTRLPMYERARRGMGYLAQERSVFQRLTVEENLLAILETRGLPKAERVARARRLMEEFGLSHLARQLGCTLSGGEARRLEIARALTTEPCLLLLDEPFSGVDPIAVAEIQGLIQGLRGRGIGILLTDHNVRESLSVTDKSYIIDNGKILASGPPREIVDNPIVRKVYLGERFSL